MFRLDEKVAIITGSAGGIGAATARRLFEAGARCVLVDVVDGSALAAELGGSSLIADVSDAEQVAGVVAQTIDRNGRLDILVNNAGVLGPAAGLVVDDLDAARQMLDINLMGVAHGVKAAVPVMSTGGVIVNTASMAGIVGFPGLGWYGAAKSAIVGMTRHAAVELGPRGIRVNCVCPTGVTTDGFAPPEAADHWAVRSQSLANQHVRRLAEPEEVAAAIHYLVSDEAAMVNGHALYVDGGLAAGPSVQLLEAALGEEIYRDGQVVE